MSRPNVLFIVADDHRHQAIHAFGDAAVQTPVLDSLIARGTSFVQNRHQGGLCAAVCVPCRAALLTGVDTFHNSISRANDDYKNLMTLREDLTTLPQAFREAGYDTFFTGKWHQDKPALNRSFTAGENIFLGGMHDHFSTPVHSFDPTGQYNNPRTPEQHSTELFTDAALQYLEHRESDKPFFLHLSYTSPHDPRTAPAEWHAKYAPEGIPLPENFLPEHPFDLGDYHIRDEELAGFPRTEAEVRQHIADYYAMISHHDHHIGRVLDTLKQSGQLENTIVVYTADHGLAVGQHGLMGKQNMYDHSMRVPLIVAGPGVPENTRSEALTYTMDIYPTLCELAGIDTPNSVQSPSLLPAMRDGAKGREYLACVYKSYQRAITDGRFKLIRYYHDPQAGQGVDRVQLFDLADDPHETRDLSNLPSHQAELTRLDNALADWQTRHEDPIAGRS